MNNEAPSCTDPARRRLIVVSAALGCLLLADIGFRAARPRLGAYTVRHFQHKMDAARNRPPPEIVLLGSSRTYFGLSPREFEDISGLSTFNLGIACSKTLEWQLVAERLIPALRPRLTVLGVNAGEFRADYLPTYAARNLFTLDDLVTYVREDGPAAPVLGEYARKTLGPLWAAYDQRYESRMWLQEQFASCLPTYGREARQLREFLAKPCPHDGYEHPWLSGRSLRTLPERAADGAAPSQVELSLEAPGFQHLDRFLTWFRDNSYPLIVAYIPNSPSVEARWSALEPRVIEAMAAICSRHNVPFLPCYGGDLPRTDADYSDEFHVGLPLARRLSRRVAEAAVDLGVLTPREPELARAAGEGGGAR